MVEQYRRKEDESLKLLLTLNERVANFQSNLKDEQSSQKIDLREVQKKQEVNPCSANSVRISHLEKAAWMFAGAILALIIKTIYFLVTT